MVFVLRDAHVFLMGMLIWKASRTNKSRLLLLLPICLIPVAMRNYFPYNPLPDTLWTIFLVILFYLAVNGRLRFLEHPWLFFLGAISYSLYLTHARLGRTLLDGLTAKGIDMDIAVLAALIACVLVASFFTFVIERPSLRYLKSLRSSRS